MGKTNWSPENWIWNLWTFKTADDFSFFLSYDNVRILFKRMSESSNVAKKFSTSQTKLFYIARHGSGPVILKELVNEVDRSRNVYTLLLDVKQAAKQIDFLINYCSISENQVATRNLDWRFSDHAKADDLCE